MTNPYTLQLPVIVWSPRLGRKTVVTPKAAPEPRPLEAMTLNELLFHALAE